MWVLSCVGTTKDSFIFFFISRKLWWNPRILSSTAHPSILLPFWSWLRWTLSTFYLVAFYGRIFFLCLALFFFFLSTQIIFQFNCAFIYGNCFFMPHSLYVFLLYFIVFKGFLLFCWLLLLAAPNLIWIDTTSIFGSCLTLGMALFSHIGWAWMELWLILNSLTPKLWYFLLIFQIFPPFILAVSFLIL